jgi:hypothetical protein
VSGEEEEDNKPDRLVVIVRVVRRILFLDDDGDCEMDRAEE